MHRNSDKVKYMIHPIGKNVFDYTSLKLLENLFHLSLKCF